MNLVYSVQFVQSINTRFNYLATQTKPNQTNRMVFEFRVIVG